VAIAFQAPIGAGRCEARRQAVPAIDVPSEFQVVGQDQVGESLSVAGELLVFLDLAQVLADILGLDMAEGLTIHSRLGCQAVVRGNVVVEIPK